MSLPRSLAIVFILLLASCSSSVVDEFADLQAQMTGEWAWLESTGGFAGQAYTPESEGYEQHLIFHPLGAVEVFRNDTLHSTGSYALVHIRWGGEERPGLEIESDNTPFPFPMLIRSVNDELHLQDACLDCFDHKFSRSR